MSAKPTRKPCCWQCGSVRKLTAYHSAGGVYHLCAKCEGADPKKGVKHGR